MLTAFSSLLRKDLDAELAVRARTDLDFIVDAATRMQFLLQNLLDLSRIGSNVMHRSEVAVDVCVDHALQTLGSLIVATGATIIRDPLPHVLGNQDMLTQLYHHLLSNALKFHGAHRPVIRLTVDQQGEQRVFGV